MRLGRGRKQGSPWLGDTAAVSRGLGTLGPGSQPRQLKLSPCLCLYQGLWRPGLGRLEPRPLSLPGSVAGPAKGSQQGEGDSAQGSEEQKGGVGVSQEKALRQEMGGQQLCHFLSHRSSCPATACRAPWATRSSADSASWRWRGGRW